MIDSSEVNWCYLRCVKNFCHFSGRATSPSVQVSLSKKLTIGVTKEKDVVTEYWSVLISEGHLG